MGDDTSFDDTIHAIHEALGKAEQLLPQLGENLQFVVGPLGDLEIVRRGTGGETSRPKVVIAELTGTDPMLWRPEHPAWMRALAERADGGTPKPDNGRPPGSGENETGNGDSEPPAGTRGNS